MKKIVSKVEFIIFSFFKERRKERGKDERKGGRKSKRKGGKEGRIGREAGIEERKERKER